MSSKELGPPPIFTTVLLLKNKCPRERVEVFVPQVDEAMFVIVEAVPQYPISGRPSEQIAHVVVQLVGEQEQRWTSSKLTLRAQGSEKLVEQTMDYHPGGNNYSYGNKIENNWPVSDYRRYSFILNRKQ